MVVYLFKELKSPYINRGYLVWGGWDSNSQRPAWQAKFRVLNPSTYNPCVISVIKKEQIMTTIYKRYTNFGDVRYYGSITLNGKRIRKLLGYTRKGAGARR